MLIIVGRGPLYTAVQGSQIEPQSVLESAFEEESKAFQALFESMDIAHKPEFEYWENKLQLKQSVIYECLYLQGLKDGMQLANASTAPPVPRTKTCPVVHAV